MNDLVVQMQTYVAYTSVGPSTVRGQKTPGLVSRLRNLLAGIDLTRFAQVSESEFQSLLDAETESIRRRMLTGTKHWGIARKVLNIFLRGAFYNFYLQQKFTLAPLEHLLEIPLDSLTVGGLKGRSAARTLPRWTGVKYLTANASAIFQKRALEIASEQRIPRVHLDIYLWLERN